MQLAVSRCSGEMRSSNSSKPDRGLLALAEIEFVGADGEPVVGRLVDVEAASEGDVPAVVEFDPPVVECAAEFHGQLDPVLKEAVFDGSQLGLDLLFLEVVIVGSGQVNLLDGSGIDADLAESQEVHDLMLKADIRIFDVNFLGSTQVVQEEPAV